MDSVAILDYGSQYSQLIARRVRELNIYCELFRWDSPREVVQAMRPVAFILSGGPHSVRENDAPTLPSYVLGSGKPVLGICYGMQLLTRALGGSVAASARQEYGPATITVEEPNLLLPIGQHPVWMSHGDRIESAPAGFTCLASSSHSPIAAIGQPERDLYGVQFHPEVGHTPGGMEILRRFLVDIAHARPDWTPDSIIQQAVDEIRRHVGDGRVLAAFSGGVDSSVAVTLVQKAIPGRLTAVFVDHGLLRQDERRQVESTFRKLLGSNFVVADEEKTFLAALKGITEPEDKRRIIGETFIRAFERQAVLAGKPEFLLQGTIYPDVVESSASKRSQAGRIKTHHNVGGLPEDIEFQLVEPLRYLFKDEVRAVGESLGLPAEVVWRQPFPGPGLAVRCLGEVTPERLAVLRAADAIFTGELSKAGHLPPWRDTNVERVSQAFAALLPVRSVGVMGDQRTYQEVVVLRAVTTDDYMTADWARLPLDLLARVSSRIVNEVRGVNRVVYDVTSKPPATIEWE